MVESSEKTKYGIEDWNNILYRSNQFMNQEEEYCDIDDDNKEQDDIATVFESMETGYSNISWLVEVTNLLFRLLLLFHFETTKMEIFL